MKRWLFVLLLMTVLVCVGCQGSGPGIEPPQSSADRAEDRLQNGTGRQPAEVTDAGAVKNGEKIGAVGKELAAALEPTTTGAAGDGAKDLPAAPVGEAKNTPAATASGSKAAPDEARGNSVGDDGKPSAKVSLWVTRDYAHSQLYGREVALTPGVSVMDLLTRHLEVKTGYGGGFVDSINGLSSGYAGADKQTRDWFYYANGILTAVGALDYKPVAGDVIWWDYHDWGGAVFTPSLIGAFPAPFVGGYRGQNPGTVVFTTPGSEQLGEQVAGCLRQHGAKNVVVQPYAEEAVTNSTKISVVVGLWADLAGDGFWQGLQQQRKKTGLFIEFAQDYFATLNTRGEVVQRYNRQVGAVTATGSGMGDATPVWLVTGLDQAGLEQAVHLITVQSAEMHQLFGALVSGDQVLAVPVVEQ